MFSIPITIDDIGLDEQHCYEFDADLDFIGTPKTRKKVNRTSRKHIKLLKKDNYYLVSISYGCNEWAKNSLHVIYLDFNDDGTIDMDKIIDSRGVKEKRRIDTHPYTYEFLSVFTDVIYMDEHICVSKLKDEMRIIDNSDFWKHFRRLRDEFYKNIEKNRRV